MILFRRKLIKKLKDAYGKEPVTTYFDGDMNWIRTTCDDRREEEPERFYVDDTTWNDLNMDTVYKRINACCSTAGEQHLYHMLRRPMNREEFDKQREMISMMEQAPEKRLKLQVLLSRLGVKLRADRQAGALDAAAGIYGERYAPRNSPEKLRDGDADSELLYFPGADAGPDQEDEG